MYIAPCKENYNQEIKNKYDLSIVIRAKLLRVYDPVRKSAVLSDPPQKGTKCVQMWVVCISAVRLCLSGCAMLSHPPKSCSVNLDLGDGALLDPGLDRFQSVDGIHDSAQSWVGFQQIALDHVVHVVGDTCEVDVGPGQLWVKGIDGS